MADEVATLKNDLVVKGVKCRVRRRCVGTYSVIGCGALIWISSAKSGRRT